MHSGPNADKKPTACRAKRGQKAHSMQAQHRQKTMHAGLNRDKKRHDF